MKFAHIGGPLGQLHIAGCPKVGRAVASDASRHASGAQCQKSKIRAKIKLDIKTCVSLDKYSGMNRREMEIKGIWNDFQMSKAKVIKWALSESSDTYFLDAKVPLTPVA